MLIPVYTRQFERAFKRVRKRGKNLEKFKSIARTLAPWWWMVAFNLRFEGLPDQLCHRDSPLGRRTTQPLEQFV